MRTIVSVLFLVLIIALIICAILARNSRKAIGNSVALLMVGFIPPLLGNMIIIASGNKILSVIGYYIYFLGMDIVVYTLLRFAFKYCSYTWERSKTQLYAMIVLIIDVVQYACNPFYGHAFGTDEIEAYGYTYYKLVPYVGQTFHRVVCYGIFAAILVVFIVKWIRTPRIYSEKYSVIVFSMVAGALWQAFYIFSGTPIDRSMIGFAAFAILVFYFSIYYRPMRLLDRILANVAAESTQALYFFDASGRCIWANEPGLEFIGAEEDRLEGVMERLVELFGITNQKAEEWSIRRVLDSGKDVRYFIIEKHKVLDKKRLVGAFISARDNTEEQKLLQQEKYNATHDNLTDLYTKEHLFYMIRNRLTSDIHTTYSIIYIDVKNFKIVNDIFGSDFGDFALNTISGWMRKIFSERCIFGRLGGDTFGVFLPASTIDEQALEHELSNFVVEYGQVSYHILIHMGIYGIRVRELEISAMFDRAHLALTKIKDIYNQHVAFYDEEMREKLLWDQEISGDFFEALEEKQFVPYLQPIVDNMRKTVGAEMLARWQHPKHGLLLPGRFIPMFEDNGMIVDIDRYMWRAACELLAKWSKDNNDLFVSINISPKDFYYIDVPKELTDLVAEYNVNPSGLRIEITESVMMTDIDKKIDIIKALKQAGFIVEMDDFGSGFSSLNLLKNIPVDVLKIDMMFLGTGRDRKKTDVVRASTIVQSIINLSEDLNISSLTEGVETEEQFRKLSEMGCNLFQGYYFAKPMPVDEFEDKYN